MHSDNLANAKSISTMIRGNLLFVKDFPFTVGLCDVSLFDYNGRCVVKYSIDKKSVNNSFTIDMTKIARGSYMVRVSDHEGKTQATKVCYW
jgi:hypothetical protein